MGKGEETKIRILNKGFELASKLGLECLSIGTLANSTSMSKSGLFGHFNSKENLQLAVMEHAGEIFNQEVVLPALLSDRGIPRIRKIIQKWIEWTLNLSGGCIFVSAAAEYSDRPGIVRDSIRKQHNLWNDCLVRIAQSAVKAGHFKKNTNCSLFAFELYSLILGFFLYHNALNAPDAYEHINDSVERLINSYKL
jgi:AcrR family transcriptional regulator